MDSWRAAGPSEARRLISPGVTAVPNDPRRPPQTGSPRDLRCDLLDLHRAVKRLSGELPREVQAESERPRLPSVFAASCDKDLKLLNRCYAPNIFAWDLCHVGVEDCHSFGTDDVDDLQLRVAYRLRSRAEQLQKSDLEQLRQLQRKEMSEADEFMQGFDAQHWLQNQGPVPEKASAGPPEQRSRTARPSRAAGPLPRTLGRRLQRRLPPPAPSGPGNACTVLGRAEMDLELIDEDGVARRDRSAGTPVWGSPPAGNPLARSLFRQVSSFHVASTRFWEAVLLPCAVVVVVAFSSCMELWVGQCVSLACWYAVNYYAMGYTLQVLHPQNASGLLWLSPFGGTLQLALWSVSLALLEVVLLHTTSRTLAQTVGTVLYATCGCLWLHLWIAPWRWLPEGWRPHSWVFRRREDREKRQGSSPTEDGQRFLRAVQAWIQVDW
eukprot:g110.t1